MTRWFEYIESSRTQSNAHWYSYPCTAGIVRICISSCGVQRLSCWIWKCNTNRIIGATNSLCYTAYNNSVSTNAREAPPVVNKMCVSFWKSSERSRCKASVAPWFSYVAVSITRACRGKGNTVNNVDLMVISAIVRRFFFFFFALPVST